MKLREAISITLVDYVIDILYLDENGCLTLANTVNYNDLDTKERKRLGEKEIASIKVYNNTSEPNFVDGTVVVKPVVVFCVEEE